MKKVTFLLLLSLFLIQTSHVSALIVNRPGVFFGGFNRGFNYWRGGGGYFGYRGGGGTGIVAGGHRSQDNYELYYPYHADNYLYDECPDDHATGEMSEDGCYELYVHYEPYFYRDCYCVTENTPSFIEKCEYVDKYYEVERYRYVPHWSCEKICRIVPEYRYEDECETGCSGPTCHCEKKYFEVMRCRQYPERYTETICRREPVYWYETVWKEHKKNCSETRCRCIPNYYWVYVGEPCCYDDDEFDFFDRENEMFIDEVYNVAI